MNFQNYLSTLLYHIDILYSTESKCFCVHHYYFSFLQCVIDNQALPCLLNLLTTNHKKSIKKEACWTISNITAGNKEQIQVCVLKILLIFQVFYIVDV
jgi:hypothetical protein